MTDTVSAPNRIAQVCGGDEKIARLIARMVDLSQQALPAMFSSTYNRSVFTMRRTPNGPKAEGYSLRYSAIVLLGAANLDEAVQRLLFAGQNAAECCGRLISEIELVGNLGDVALLTWAAAELEHPQLAVAVARLRQLWRRAAHPFTVQAAWALSALSRCGEREMAEMVRQRLATAFSEGGNVFAHRIGITPRLRGHVACFADQVYPIQALSRFSRAFGCDASLEIAARCAGQICRAQGDGGQWWWHYDFRTGQVVEGYPVYSVHQNSMAPMALLDLHEAGGPDFAAAIRRGLLWMDCAPEINLSLIDEQNRVIWRKVGRSDPKKIVRAARAVASGMHPSLRMRWLNMFFPARTVDWECRPYHLGWILHCWLAGNCE